jgi:hypothetical protein
MEGSVSLVLPLTARTTYMEAQTTVKTVWEELGPMMSIVFLDLVSNIKSITIHIFIHGK